MSRGNAPAGLRRSPIRLDANEAPWDLPPRLRRRALDAVAGVSWNRYPPADQGRLRAALAGYAGVTPEAVVAANGSDELIQLVMLALGPARGPGGIRRVVVCPPTFGGYAHAAAAAGLAVRPVPLLRPSYTPAWPAVADAARDPQTLVVLCRPNNPTGTTWPSRPLERLLIEARGPLVVDEAYAEFAGASLGGLVAGAEGPPAGVLRTLSKAVGLAGIRLGYAVGNPGLVAALERVRMPFNVGAPAAAVAVAALEAPALVRRRARRLAALRDALAGALAARPGVRVLPSAANFVAFETDQPEERVWEGLRARGVWIRRFDDAAAAGLLRVAAGTPAEQAVFLAALDATLAALRGDQAAAGGADGRARPAEKAGQAGGGA